MNRKKSYQQEMLEWQWKQLRLRRKYASTPAGFSDKEAEKEAVRQWKYFAKTVGMYWNPTEPCQQSPLPDGKRSFL